MIRKKEEKQNIDEDKLNEGINIYKINIQQFNTEVKHKSFKKKVYQITIIIYNTNNNIKLYDQNSSDQWFKAYHSTSNIIRFTQIQNRHDIIN